MKEKINIDQPRLKENPFTVPEGYFSMLDADVQERISEKVPKAGWWSIVKPQLALVSTFCIIMLMGYAAITLFSPDITNSGNTQGQKLLEEHQLSSSFIDFYDEELDTLSQTKEINNDQIVEYLDTDASLVYLASLE